MVEDSRRVDRVSPVLVGRSEAVDLAVRRWDATVSGPGHTLFVTGEARIGKSRMRAELPARLGGAVTVVDAATFPRDAQAAGAVMLALADGFRRAGPAKIADRRLAPNLTGLIHTAAQLPLFAPAVEHQEYPVLVPRHDQRQRHWDGEVEIVEVALGTDVEFQRLIAPRVDDER